MVRLAAACSWIHHYTQSLLPPQSIHHRIHPSLRQTDWGGWKILPGSKCLHVPDAASYRWNGLFQLPGNRLNGFHALTKPGDIFAMPLQIAVCDKPHIHIRDTAEGRAQQLIPDIAFPCIRRNQKQGMRWLGRQPQRQIQHPHNPGINGRRMLNLESCCHPSGRGFDPQYINQADRAAHRLENVPVNTSSRKQIDEILPVAVGSQCWWELPLLPPPACPIPPSSPIQPLSTTMTIANTIVLHIFLFPSLSWLITTTKSNACDRTHACPHCAAPCLARHGYPAKT